MLCLIGNTGIRPCGAMRRAGRVVSGPSDRPRWYRCTAPRRRPRGRRSRHPGKPASRSPRRRRLVGWSTGCFCSGGRTRPRWRRTPGRPLRSWVLPTGRCRCVKRRRARSGAAIGAATATRRSPPRIVGMMLRIRRRRRLGGRRRRRGTSRRRRRTRRRVIARPRRRFASTPPSRPASAPAQPHRPWRRRRRRRRGRSPTGRPVARVFRDVPRAKMLPKMLDA